MPVLVGKLDDFIFDRGAISRSSALDFSRIHRTARNPGANQVVGLGIGKSYMAGNLRQFDMVFREAKFFSGSIAPLNLQLGIINAFSIQSRAGAGFQST